MEKQFSAPLFFLDDRGRLVKASRFRRNSEYLGRTMMPLEQSCLGALPRGAVLHNGMIGTLYFRLFDDPSKYGFKDPFSDNAFRTRVVVDLKKDTPENWHDTTPCNDPRVVLEYDPAQYENDIRNVLAQMKEDLSMFKADQKKQLRAHIQDIEFGIELWRKTKPALCFSNPAA